MKNLMILLLLTSAIATAHAQKILTYQLMEPGFNTKVIKGSISEVYTTKRYGKTFWWVRIGTDTIIHVWPRHLDTATMKPGVNRAFHSIKRLDNSWWKKEKSKDYVKLKE
ncbi:hypothetical protein EZ456_00925 [Pedobacter psychrodurus]|uniref:Uncharacterized protein n=1 Tax=Pedobacter psychrodurus TaxID=2530456 RepID=A0A4R0QBE0_9SPHI|nr:hypothetical protein [Pedobacter psychrodurus]TCD29611.1 hypothetical protein EZ456_00925 [Pedobacter psychrodurus]